MEKNALHSPLTTTSVAIDTLSTLVCTAQVYFPACLSWMLRIMMSPADRWNVWKMEIKRQKVAKRNGPSAAEFRHSVLGGVHRQAQCQNDFCLEWLYYIMEEKGTSQVQGWRGGREKVFRNRLWGRSLCREGLKSFFQLRGFYSLPADSHSLLNVLLALNFKVSASIKLMSYLYKCRNAKQRKLIALMWNQVSRIGTGRTQTALPLWNISHERTGETPAPHPLPLPVSCMFNNHVVTAVWGK